ncbi:hypothetical protein [Thermoactinomyces mirandus]|uniref:Uncharacterized protein n=1 Tax=Thermoactinomyces mirandus TaxID=2756294 RepID=A0A7W1XT93_9BACL|nr:hypothetical protein [Thermoactinomyces mirandus]MBA4602814.1 hypothetical protein [Thermoactinomyces mirandus]
MSKLLLFTTWDHLNAWHVHRQAIPAWTEEHAGDFDVMVEFGLELIGEMTDHGIFIIRKRKKNQSLILYLYTKWELLLLWQSGHLPKLDCWTRDHSSKNDTLAGFSLDEIQIQPCAGMFIAQREVNPYIYPRVKGV